MGNCSICLESLLAGGPIVTLMCGHLFHEECVQSWIFENSTCPLCRRDSSDESLGTTLYIKLLNPPVESETESQVADDSEDLKERIKVLEEKLEKAVKETFSLQDTQNVATRLLEAAIQEKNRALAQLTQLLEDQTQIKTAQLQLEEKFETLAQYSENTAAKLREEKDCLQQQLTATQEELVAQCSLVQYSENTAAKLREEKDCLQQQLTATQEELAAQCSLTQYSENTAAKLREEKDSLQQQLTTSQEKLTAQCRKLSPSSLFIKVGDATFIKENCPNCRIVVKSKKGRTKEVILNHKRESPSDTAPHQSTTP